MLAIRPTRGAKTGHQATMLTASRIDRALMACAVACALFGFGIAGPVAISAGDAPHTAAALSQERYYSSYSTPQPSAAALAHERYYSSYGQPEPPIHTQSHETPWLPIAHSLAIALALAVASATQVRRIRTRRRAVRAVA
jgi:hypothetical protein